MVRKSPAAFELKGWHGKYSTVRFEWVVLSTCEATWSSFSLLVYSWFLQCGHYLQCMGEMLPFRWQILWSLTFHFEGINGPQKLYINSELAGFWNACHFTGLFVMLNVTDLKCGLFSHQMRYRPVSCMLSLIPGTCQTAGHIKHLTVYAAFCIPICSTQNHHADSFIGRKQIICHR